MREENESYYNALGVNLKYHLYYRMAYINVEILNMPPASEQQAPQIVVAPIKMMCTPADVPVVYAPEQEQQVPLPTFAFPAFSASEQQQPQPLYPSTIN